MPKNIKYNKYRQIDRQARVSQFNQKKKKKSRGQLSLTSQLIRGVYEGDRKQFSTLFVIASEQVNKGDIYYLSLYK